MSLLKVSDISVAEDGITILEHINFEVQEFQKIAVAGETGSGKSTLLQAIAGLVQLSDGQIYFEDELVKGPHDVLVAGHPGIAYLSQQYELPRFLRVEQILKYANQLTEKEGAAIYELCRIKHLLKRKTNQLSGGERQRIALARLLTSSPRLLLLDEPFSNLDVAHKTILKSVIHAISEELEITCVLISHDPGDTLSWADEIFVMKDGKLMQHGKPEHIYQQPINTYVASLFGNFNFISAKHTKLLSLPSQFKNKDIVIRPENIKIETENKEFFIKGIVSGVTYFGSYHMLNVSLNKQIAVSVKTESNRYKKDDSVLLSFPAEDIWTVQN